MINRQQKVRTLSIFTAAVFAVALLSGCKNPDAGIIGKWNDTKGSSVTFNADKTFTQGSGTTSAAGKWSLKDKKLTVSIDTIGGKPADQVIQQLADMMAKMNPKGSSKSDTDKLKEQLKNITMTLSEDGKTLSIDGMKGGAAGAGGTLTKATDSK